jgi:histidine phosphotransfer protein HptB
VLPELPKSDSDQVMRSAHTIKGAAGNLGLMDVSETAKIIEENANNNQLDNLGATIATLKTQFDAIEAFVHG